MEVVCPECHLRHRCHPGHENPKLPAKDHIYVRDSATPGPGGKDWPRATSEFSETLKRYRYYPYEWTSLKYRKYRENSHPNNTAIQKRQQKNQAHWSDEVEYAFQKALRFYGGRGRAQERLGGKISGGNEWIAWCIWVQTAIKFDRKQVGSHMQVLRNFMRKNVEWQAIAEPLLSGERRLHSKNNLVPLTNIGPLSTKTIPQVSIHDLNFDICLHSPKQLSTAQNSRPSSTKRNPLSSEWTSRFPDLQLFNDFEIPISCYELENELGLLDGGDAGSQAATCLTLKMHQDARYWDWKSTYQIHDGNIIYQSDEWLLDGHLRENIMTIDQDSYWTVLRDHLKEGTAGQEADTGASKKVQETKDQPSRPSDGIFMLQEIWARSQNSPARKCLILLLWRFSDKASSTVTPSTTWRALDIVPPVHRAPPGNPTKSKYFEASLAFKE